MASTEEERQASTRTAAERMLQSQVREHNRRSGPLPEPPGDGVYRFHGSTEPGRDVTPALGAALAEPACVFCARIEAGEFDYFDCYCVAFQPLSPVTPGHFLVVSRRHAASALDATESAGRAVAFAANLAVEMGLEACNFITSAGAAASQSVMHLHVHVVPRREGDGLALPWADLGSFIKDHDRAERAEAKLAAIVAYCSERAEEISDRMLRVRPEDIRIDAGDILAIISAPDGP
jgi:histidine triad (HIT) family protein